MVVFAVGLVVAVAAWLLSTAASRHIDSDDSMRPLASRLLVWSQAMTGPGSLITPYRIFMLTTGAAIFLLMVPIVKQEFTGVWNTGLAALYQTVRVLIANADMDTAIASFHEADSWLPRVEATYTIGLYTLAPIMTVGLILTFFQAFSAHFRYLAAWWRTAYIFSELNDRSITLAESIARHDRRRHRHETIVFTDVILPDNEPSVELIGRAQRLGAICFSHDILSLSLRRHSSFVDMNLFVIGSDEVRDITTSTRLVKQYGQRRNTNIYVFSDRIETALAFSYRPDHVKQSDDTGLVGRWLMKRDCANPPHARVRRLNPARTLIYDWLWRDQTTWETVDGKRHRVVQSAGLDLFDHAAPDGDDRIISAVVLGLGSHGTEMVRALAWYCQMNTEHSTYRLRVNAFDIDNATAERFKEEHPELVDGPRNEMSPRARTARQDAIYDIRIWGGADVTNPHVLSQILKIDPVTFVFVCLGDDALNLEVATMLRRTFARAHRPTQIVAVSKHSQELNRALDMQAERIHHAPLADAAYLPTLQMIGDLKDNYRFSAVIQSDIEHMALVSHMWWAVKDYGIKDHEAVALPNLRPGQWQASINQFWDDEYSYRSSMAVPIHWKARRALNVPGARQPHSLRDDAAIDGLKRLEHARWAAFMRSEGFICGDVKDQLAAKTHPLLVNFDALSENNKDKDDNDAHDVLQYFEQSLKQQRNDITTDETISISCIEGFISNERTFIADPYAEPGSPGRTLRIGITGHRNIAPASVEGVRHLIDEYLADKVDALDNHNTRRGKSDWHRHLIAVSCLADGADQIFAQEALRFGATLETMIPFDGYENTLLGSRDTYLDLLWRSHPTNTPPIPDPKAENVFMHLGQNLVAYCELILAVWDLGPSDGRGGTADVAELAHANNKLDAIIEYRHP